METPGDQHDIEEGPPAATAVEAPILDPSQLDPTVKYKEGEYDPIARMIKPGGAPGRDAVTKKMRGASTEFANYMVQRRAGLKLIDYDLFREGPNRLRRSRRESEEAALEALVPKALKVLKEQLDSPDERVQQSAAVKVLEYAKGKPVQQVKAEVAGISKIIYESAAYVPQTPVEAASQVLELVAIDDDDEPEGATETDA